MPHEYMKPADVLVRARARKAPTAIRDITPALDESGVAAIEVAQNDGLAGSSLNYGFGAHSDDEWIIASAEVIRNPGLTTLLLPGIGTLHDLKLALDLGVSSVRIATHCTKADVAAQHICTARALGFDVAGFLKPHHNLSLGTAVRKIFWSILRWTCWEKRRE